MVNTDLICTGSPTAVYDIIQLANHICTLVADHQAFPSFRQTDFYPAAGYCFFVLEPAGQVNHSFKTIYYETDDL